MRLRPSLFWILLTVQLWFAHAICYLIHEYAHSFTACFVHYKSSPLAITYGHLNLANILLQVDMDENVDYDTIFAAARGLLAALIALAGVLIGNGISYLAGLLLYAKAKQKKMRGSAMFFFWVCAMSVGNFLSYVPIRTFTTHADMATAEKGLGVSPWVIAVLLGIPFAIAMWHFFANILPDAEQFLFPVSLRSQRVLVLLTTFSIFVYYGNAGLHGYGSVSRWLSMFSAVLLFPAVSIICWPRSGGKT